jgi:predicted Zn-dependent peptidase
MVASLSGRIDFDRCVDQIAKATTSWMPAKVGRDYRPPQPVISDHHLTRAATSMHYLVALSDAPSAQDDRRYAAAVLANVLGDSDGSRLYWKLIDPGIADEAEISHHSFDQTGVNLMYLSCSPNQAERAEAVFDEVLTGAAENLTAEEVERATRKMAMDLTLQNERPAGRMMALGAQWLYLNRYLPLADELTRLGAVSVDDLKSLLEAYPLTPRAAVRLSPAPAAVE